MLGATQEKSQLCGHMALLRSRNLNRKKTYNTRLLSLRKQYSVKDT